MINNNTICNTKGYVLDNCNILNKKSNIWDNFAKSSFLNFKKERTSTVGDKEKKQDWRVENSAGEWRTILESGYQYWRVENSTGEWRTVLESGEQCWRVENIEQY